MDAAHGAFSSFVDTVAPWRSSGTPAAELAAYVLWSATVRPQGFVTRPAVLMSKHWMDKVWSWDHCFNALALAPGSPGLALDQFALPFDHQDETGALPDSVAHSEILYNFVKPPIHGWTLRHLRRRLPKPLGEAELTEVYDRLARWTDFWLTMRRAPGAALPHYQHGNDSGWDNATTFDPERVIVSADLAAFLVLQMRELAELAHALGLQDDARRWTRTAHGTQAAMFDELWTGDRFVARSAQSGATWTSSSLLDLMPVVLGEHLPQSIGDALADRIEAHLTAYGLATELPTSPHYLDDGYWRGPIWAPSTVLIEDGLRRSRPRPSRGRDQRPLPGPVRDLGLRGELRRPHRRGPARPRLHLDSQQLPPPCRGPRAEARRDRGGRRRLTDPRATRARAVPLRETRTCAYLASLPQPDAPADQLSRDAAGPP